MNPVSRLFILLLIVFVYPQYGKAQEEHPLPFGLQEKYWIFFTDKEGVEFDPYSYFDIKAIERRIKSGIPIYDYTDLPVSVEYLSAISQIADSVTKTSRWFNAVAVLARAGQIEKIKTLYFVEKVEEMYSESRVSSVDRQAKKGFDFNLTEEEKALLREQTLRMGGDEFRREGFDGEGMRIAIFDAGFPTVDKNPVFEHIRKDNRIIKTYDFLRNRENVYGHDSHGTMVFSCIAGKAGDYNIGMATGAEFLLARTESGVFEPFSEEENWLAAAEWADKNGADIINSSLGYTNNRYFVEDMDGKKSLVARAANMAASKGMLVVNAAGNDGDGDWKYLGTPADADSVLSVGGIDPVTNYHIYFSSYGPTADKRLKPNVCAYGEVMASGEKGYEDVSGTSFASPLVAGFVACAWQSDKNLTNMEMFREIERSGDLFPYFDYAHGYGVPQASYFTGEKQSVKPTFSFKVDGETLKVIINEDFIDEEDDNSLPDPRNYAFETLLFYHIQNKKGYLDKYYVISVDQKNVLTFYFNDYKENEILRVHFNGYTANYQF